MLKNLLSKNSFINKYQHFINKINILENYVKTLSDNELRAKNFKLQKQYQDNQNLDLLIVESFALTREASIRTLGLRHFDVQLIGGLVLNNQNIAEIKTGEGKTLIATLPAMLNALGNKGVHIVTVNDYLANRDKVLMSQIYRFFNLNIGLIQEGMSTWERKKNYNADITYVTNYQLVFDFLRDNMALNLTDIVLRPFNYCIIDEVDCILIDDAQTPFMISRNIPTTFDKYFIAKEIIDHLELNIHYIIDEKNKNIVLMDKGTRFIEQILNIQTLYDPKNPWILYILNALKANVLYFDNIHYIIHHNRPIIVDNFTGRIMPNRRWGDGLHQAIEAKEILAISKKLKIIASITYQNFFLLYPKLSGMTGTGKTAEIEFEKFYNLSVTEIPTAKPVQRKNLPDLMYKNTVSKLNAVGQACKKITLIGQPILIGTTTIQNSEIIAELLNKYQLFYKILNAKPENLRYESQIIAQAGIKGSITISTNLAGRGTDIILGGDINFKIKKELYYILRLLKNYSFSKNINIFQLQLLNQLKGYSQKFLSVLLSLLNDPEFFQLSDIDILQFLEKNDQIFILTTFYQFSIKFLINELLAYHKKYQKQKNKIVKNLGGLYVIGTERNNSKRVDNQLRGRCGRQGDPGISRFFLSLDDDLLRFYGRIKIQQLNISENAPLTSNLITKNLDFAQKQVEEKAYQTRKNLFGYNDIINKQCKIIYHERQQFLKNSVNSVIQKSIYAYGEQIITELLVNLQEKTIPLIENLFGRNITLNYSGEGNFLQNKFDLYELKIYLFTEFWLTYKLKINEFSFFNAKIIKNLEKNIILMYTDQIWSEHLQKLTLLQEVVEWRKYGKKNPLYEYKQEALQLFKTRKKILRHLILYELLRFSL